jgi:hypothetical protein
MKNNTLIQMPEPSRRCSFLYAILDFQRKCPEEPLDIGVVDLINDGAELQLTTNESNNIFGSVANVRVDDVDGLFEKYRKRRPRTSPKKESPVHQGPLDQTWGTREFYVTDNDGNTLRFCEVL